MTDNYIVLDTETTGLNPARDKVLEIGAARIEQGRVVETFETLIDTGVPIPMRCRQKERRRRKHSGNFLIFAKICQYWAIILRLISVF